MAKNWLRVTLREVFSGSVGKNEAGYIYANEPKVALMNMAVEIDESGILAHMVYALKKPNSHFIRVKPNAATSSLEWCDMGFSRDIKPDVWKHKNDLPLVTVSDSFHIPVVYPTRTSHGFIWDILRENTIAHLDIIRSNQHRVMSWCREQNRPHNRTRH